MNEAGIFISGLVQQADGRFTIQYTARDGRVREESDFAIYCAGGRLADGKTVLINAFFEKVLPR